MLNKKRVFSEERVYKLKSCDIAKIESSSLRRYDKPGVRAGAELKLMI